MKKVPTKKNKRPIRKRAPAKRATRGKRTPGVEPAGHLVDLAREVAQHPETSPRLTGGDLDANWASAYAVGDEAVGGSVATPDQDVVDEIGEALGVAQAPDAEVQTSAEILRQRDRDRWRLEREAARERP